MSDPDPRLTEARHLLDTARYEEARVLFKQLIDDKSEVANAQLCYGVSFIREGKYAEAAEYFESLPPSPETLINLSVCYLNLKDEAREAGAVYKLLRLTRDSKFEGAYRKLANWAKENEQWGIFYDALLVLFEIDSEDIAVCMALADTCKKMAKHKQAVTFYMKALEITDDQNLITTIHALLSGLYKDAAQQDKALYHFRRTYALAKNINAASNLIMYMQYANGVDFRMFYEQCREYSARFLRDLPRHQFSADFLNPAKARDGLRIGFSSGDFVLHSLSNLLLEPFKRFKEVAPRHQLFIYSAREAEKEDKVSAEYKDTVDVWRCIHGLSDKEAAQKIYDDKIDVLVEIAGHTAYNRLPVFGYKPAPVQVGWVSGMMTPPAIETINYFMTDRWIRPDCADEICFEKLYNLPAAYCYFPLANAPGVVELPFKKNGYISFGSFNNPCKLSDEVLDTWAAVLKRVPNSHLHVKVYTASTERYIKSRYAQHGIHPERVHAVYPLPRAEDLMAYYTNNVDIVLDTWPCAGCLTSAEAMWMGCPVVTYYGETFLHRQSWTILNQVDLTELGSDTLEGFVNAAVALAEDHTKLEDIRKNLRSKMESAPIRDPLGMAKGVLASLEDAWVDWCKSRIPLQEALA